MNKQFKLIYSTDLFVTRRELDLTDLVRVDYLPMQANTLLQLIETDSTGVSRPVSDLVMKRMGSDLSVTLVGQSDTPTPALVLTNFFNVVPYGAQPFVVQASNGSNSPLVLQGSSLTQAQALQQLANNQSLSLQVPLSDGATNPTSSTDTSTAPSTDSGTSTLAQPPAHSSLTVIAPARHSTRSHSARRRSMSSMKGRISASTPSVA